MLNKKLLKLYIQECIKQEINESEEADEIKTFGDLKKVLNAIVLSKGSKEKAKSLFKKAGIKGTLDVALDFVPYGSAAKSVAGLIKGLTKIKDEARPDSFLGGFDIDDEISKIVDNNLEDEFVRQLVSKIENKPDDAPLVGFNMTNELNNFLKLNFKGRHFKTK